MTKKNFSTAENPALQFISQPEPETSNTEKKETAPKPETPATDPATAEATTPDAKTAEKKKTAKKKPSTASTKNKGGRPKKEGETRSRRYNLLLQDSTAEALQKVAYMERASVNELVNRIAAAYIEEHKDSIEKYDSLFNGQ